ncbi:MAG: hypothetical protein QOC67_509 [Pseudonocardiales bacterium]|jgi:hypothetical protein|nr:hypothetical protein [Pseudonocardiales bacterium]
MDTVRRSRPLPEPGILSRSRSGRAGRFTATRAAITPPVWAGAHSSPATGTRSTG